MDGSYLSSAWPCGDLGQGNSVLETEQNAVVL